MKEIYRKTGRSVRWENGTLVSVSETGIATEHGDLFECAPDPSGATAVSAAAPDPPAEAAGAPLEVARRIGEVASVRIERLIVLYGEAEHTFGEKTWRDESRRIHLALTNGHLRALIDLGDFDLDPILPIAEALARAEQSERDAPPRLRLGPNVAAALIPSLAARPNVKLTQRAGGIDGKGDPVQDATQNWPNWYRPSYRVRPIRAPFNLTASCDDTEIDPTLPRAVALLEPPHDAALRVLVVDGPRVYPSRVRVTRITAIGTDVKWYPYGAGVLGAEIMLNC